MDTGPIDLRSSDPPVRRHLCLSDRSCSSYEWTLSDSNRPPPACKAGALPDELRALVGIGSYRFIRFISQCECISFRLTIRSSSSPKNFHFLNSLATLVRLKSSQFLGTPGKSIFKIQLSISNQGSSLKFQ